MNLLAAAQAAQKTGPRGWLSVKGLAAAQAAQKDHARQCVACKVLAAAQAAQKIKLAVHR